MGKEITTFWLIKYWNSKFIHYHNKENFFNFGKSLSIN